MKEIEVEHKKPIWLWLLVGLVIIAIVLVWVLGFADNDKNTEIVDKVDEYDQLEVSENKSKNKNNSRVAAYINFVKHTNKKMSADHAYTNEALIKLADATNAIADEVGFEVRADLEKVKEHANMITKDPSDKTHADHIRKSANILTNVLQNIQKAKFPDLADEAKELRSASVAINPQLLTLDQKDAVENYFAKAADLLQKMN